MIVVRSSGFRTLAPWGCLLFGLLLTASVSAWAGSVVEMRGEAQVERGQQIIPLRAGTALEDADKVVTGPGAEVLLRFEDDARMLVRPESKVDLRQLFRKDEAQRQQIITVLKGGLRYLSSILTVRRQVTFTSAQATIGIRGTDIEIALDEPGLTGRPSGTYLKVNHGIAVLSGLDGSEVELSEGQVALALEAELSRAGVRSIRRPSAMRMEAAPAHLFQPGALDSLLR